MRVISGTLKGREIKGYNIEGTRPTMDRVKESVFATIQEEIKGATVLDLFAGSGNLGIEAISNGSNFCYFVDNNNDAIHVLNDNINKFNINNKVRIIQSDYNKALKNFKNTNTKFNIIFVDPPYKDNISEKIIDKINEYQLLKNKGLIVIECQNKQLNHNYDNLYLQKKKKYSDKYIYIYKNNIDNQNN